MAASLWKICNLSLNAKVIPSNVCGSVRLGHHLRGKPPGIAKSLQQRIDEVEYKDPEVHFRVDIGLPSSNVETKADQKLRLELVKKNRQNAALEQKSRTRQLLIDLKETKKVWARNVGQYQIKTIADHYGVYEHLFGDAYFVPRVPLNIVFNSGNYETPVYYGNIIKPREATTAPNVSFESDDKSFWTLVLTNPDGHLSRTNSEYVHWFVGNIPGNKVEKGESIIEYLQPFPPKGTGYHRHVFVLYKHSKKLDFSKYKKPGACYNLEDRTFSTLDFYRELQDDLTPSGLAFFQADWDSSLKDFFHNKLEMQEPFFEYDFPEPFIKKQQWFPIRRAFNLYMDRYRDPKQVNKEFLMRKLKNVHPFKPSPASMPYPNAIPFEGYKPTWLKLEIKKSRLKWGRINNIE